MMTQWITVHEDECERTAYLDVPGGWLYRVLLWNVTEDTAASASVVFVPNPDIQKGKN